jgi:hypothetical protein
MCIPPKAENYKFTWYGKDSDDLTRSELLGVIKAFVENPWMLTPMDKIQGNIRSKMDKIQGND